MPRETVDRRFTPRRLFLVAGGLMVFYALNVMLGMLAVKAGVATWRLGDVGEFLLVLSCMAFFVAGLIVDEDEQAAARDVAGDSNTNSGGVR